MTFFKDADNVKVTGGNFNDIKGDKNVHDISQHVHYDSSCIATTTIREGVYNDSPASGML